MGKDTSISWCDHTFNPWWGCEKVSPACKNCYAEAFAKRVGQKVWGKGGDRRVFGDKHWAEPHKWNAAAEKAGQRKRVFCASMADVFEDHPIAKAERPRLWETIASTPWLDWLLLTKRPENILAMLPPGLVRGNIWLGTTTENQEEADRRISHLLSNHAAVHFISMEPMLEPVILDEAWIDPDSDEWANTIRWVIVGGESGHHARPLDLVWAESIQKQCKEWDVAFFMKQMGAITLDGNFKELDGTPGLLAGIKDRKGGDIKEFPPGLRVREFPRLNVTAFGAQ